MKSKQTDSRCQREPCVPGGRPSSSHVTQNCTGTRCTLYLYFGGVVGTCSIPAAHFYIARFGHAQSLAIPADTTVVAGTFVFNIIFIIIQSQASFRRGLLKALLKRTVALYIFNQNYCLSYYSECNVIVSTIAVSEY